MVSLSRLKYFNGCLPQILFGPPFLNTLTHIITRLRKAVLFFGKNLLKCLFQKFILLKRLPNFKTIFQNNYEVRTENATNLLQNWIFLWHGNIFLHAVTPKKEILVDTILIILILITQYQHMFLQYSPIEQSFTYRKDFKRNTVNPNNKKLFSITTKTLWYFVSTSTALWHTGSFG